MAVAIPVIAAFASAGAAAAAAGGVLAAMGTVTGFLSIAGAALTTVGAITKNSKLTKIGGFMGLAGGIGTALGFGASAASSAAGEAASAGAIEQGLQEPISSMASSAAPAAETASQTAALEFGGAEAANKLALTPTEATGPGLRAEPKLWDRAAGVQQVGTVDPTQSVLQQRGAGLTSQDIANANRASATRTPTMWDTASNVVGKVGQFARNNKELIQMGGTALNSMFGPDAERLDMAKDRDSFDRSIYARRIANLNAPVKLTYGGG